MIYHTNKKLSDILFNSDDIRKVISGLDPSKAHWYDMISIRMLKMFGESIHKPLEYIFRASLMMNVFHHNGKQRVVLNGQCSSWASITAGVPQGSLLGPLLFLININGLSKNLSSNPKLFADDTSLFSVVHNLNTSTNNLNEDLKKINDWATQWKMSFNLDPTKQAQEVIFSHKIKKPLHTPLNYINANVKQTAFQKHLGLILDSQLSLEEHLKLVFSKVNETIRLIWKLRNSLPRPSLFTLYKSFIRPHLDYGHIIYNQPFNNSLQNKIESTQYNACLAITGAIRGTSKEILYKELGLESLQHSLWYRKLCYLYKIVVNKSPNCLFKVVNASTNIYNAILMISL